MLVTDPTTSVQYYIFEGGFTLIIFDYDLSQFCLARISFAVEPSVVYQSALLETVNCLVSNAKSNIGLVHGSLRKYLTHCRINNS